MFNIKNILIAGLYFVSLMYVPVAMADHASPSFETGVAGAIMTIPGATLGKGEFVLGTSVQFVEFDDIPDSILEAFGAADVHIHSTDNLINLKANLAFGVTGNFTIGVSVPYVERNNIRAAHDEMGVGEVEFAGDSAGLGDVSAFGQFRILHDATRDLALLGGIKTPTGTTREREEEGELFEADHQPGSGSRDPFFGLSYNRILGKLGFSGNILYTLTTEGTQQTDLGDVINYNLALSYRVFSPGGGHNHHHRGFNVLDYVDVALELNGDVRGKDEVAGVVDVHTGGHLIYFSPGVRIGFGHSWAIFSSAGIPVVNDLNGTQSDPEFRLIGGISKAF